MVSKRTKKTGLPPGTPVYTGGLTGEKINITVIDYKEDGYDEKVVDELKDCITYKETPTVTWINVDGIHDISLIEKLGQCFELHPLIVEDIVNVYQRPKMEDYEKYVYLVLKMLYFDDKQDQLEIEQVSIILGKNYVISFQEKKGDVFDILRERLRTGKGKIRKMGNDYLVYSLIDAIVDNYFVILESISERIEDLEEILLTNPSSSTLLEIHTLKRDMINLRKSVWPLRELITSLQRSERILISPETAVYLRDLYDHTVQVIDTTETFRDILAGILDIYLSSVSNKMNEVMKVLTIIATIFIPLTFIAGVYGMNFKYMPEIYTYWGYPVVLVLMLGIGLGMLLFFKKKNWF